MRLPNTSAGEVIAVLAVIGVLTLGGAMVFYSVPDKNHDYMNFILGALAGAITVSGGARINAASQGGKIEGDPKP